MYEQLNGLNVYMVLEVFILGLLAFVMLFFFYHNEIRHMSIFYKYHTYEHNIF